MSSSTSAPPTTPLGEDSSTPPTALRIARLPSRALAAFIDYLLLQSLLFSFSAVLGITEYLFLTAILLSLLYYGVGNSEVADGRTLGKRAFGLQTHHASQTRLLSLSESALRCGFQIVLPLLLIELPPLLLRNAEVVASPLVLDAPMLVVLLITLWNISLLFVNPHRRAGHDYLARSIVLQKESASEDELRTLARPYHAALHPLQATLSVLAALALWLLSVLHAPAVEQVHRLRYLLEHQLDIRIISIQSSQNVVYMQLLALSVSDKADKEGLAVVLCESVKARTNLPPYIEVLRLAIFSRESNGPSKGPQSEEFRLSTSHCTVETTASSELPMEVDSNVKEQKKGAL